MSMDYRAIGSRIRGARKAKNWTQEMLAERMQVSVGYISQIERGATKISLETLSRLAALLEQDLGKLISGTAAQQDHYLDRELADVVGRMDERQRRCLLELSSILLQF